MFDRRLATFCMSVSNLLMINIKGELNVDIQQVLQVAIYALNKIAEVKSKQRKVRFHFILRDQIEQGVAEMQSAYNSLKDNLIKAAQAAGASIKNLVTIPEKAEEIITMFPSALSLKQVNENKNFTQILTENVFRQKCSMLRLSILDLARQLEDEQRISDLKTWA